MNRKGQVYILASILLSLILYNLSLVPNIVVQQEFKGDFDKLADNYETESSKFINSVLLSGGNVVEDFTNFTMIFMSYSKSQNPNFGVITSLSYKDKIRIGNYLKKPVLVDTGTEELKNLNGCFDKISSMLIFNGITIDLAAAEIQETQECFVDITYTEKIWIGLIEQQEPLEISWYPFEIKANKPQLMIINMQEEANQRQVNIAGEGYVRKERHEVPKTRIKTVLED